MLNREDGAIGGLEVLPFGVLVFVVGALIVANAWAVIDAKIAVAAAAREAVRAYVEAPPGADAAAAGNAAARRAMAAQGRTARAPEVQISGRLVRCERVTATVSYRIPTLRLPWVRDIGSMRARSTATEIVDPLRSGLEGEADCLAAGTGDGRA